MFRGYPQGSYLGSGMWNIFYNTHLNIKSTAITTIIALADDLLLLIKRETVSDIENFANLVLIEISKWARERRFDSTKRSRKVC